MNSAGLEWVAHCVQIRAVYNTGINNKMKTITRFVPACAVMLLPLLAAAAQNNGNIMIKRDSIYLGAGIGFNSLPGVGNSVGAQLLAGYQFDFRINGDISTAVELGYMDTGDFDRYLSPGYHRDAEGVWLNVVESVGINQKLDLLVRAGLDLGDDDGLMAGAGFGYKFNNKVSWRTEYVVRDHVDSFQFNLLFRL